MDTQPLAGSLRNERGTFSSMILGRFRPQISGKGCAPGVKCRVAG